MGKKHKKHKSERRYEEDGDEKPHLKIVLKLQEGVYDSDYAASPASYSGEYSIDNEKSHKKKKKKKRHSSDDRDHHSLKIRKKGKKDYEVETIYAEDNAGGDILEEFSASTPASPEEMSQSSIILPASPEIRQPAEVVVQRMKVPMTAAMRSSLDKLLERLLCQLERKDPHEIFAWPVNDIIAPGYSAVITNPMDFSTMRKKIARLQYNEVNEFKEDFKLMIDNCCTYNRPETIFYESGKKLLAAGLKILSKERLINMKRTLGFLHDLSKVECAQIMGLPAPQEETIDVTSMEVDQSLDDITDANGQAVEGEVVPSDADYDLRAHPDAVSFTDADNEETVAPDVIEAARQAKERLAQRRPKSKMGFLRIDDVGKTTFNFINPDYAEAQSDVVDLGSLTGRLPSGMDTLPEAKEDKRNKVTPLTYLGFGPFGSFAPSYDSRIANITQEESDLLLAAYGGETEYLFAKSMHMFVKDSEYDLVSMVDDLLDTLTHGAHKSAIGSIMDKRKKAEEEKLKEEAKMEADIKVENVESFDLSPGSLQEKLDLTGDLVSKLEKTQNERLSENPPVGLPNLKPPTTQEHDLASKLRENLSELITQAKPEDVCSVTGVRKAIGIKEEVDE